MCRNNSQYKGGTIFRSGDGESPSLGIFQVIIPLPDDTRLEMSLHIFYTDVPLLVGIEVLQNHNLIPYFAKIVIWENGT